MGAQTEAREAATRLGVELVDLEAKKKSFRDPLANAKEEERSLENRLEHAVVTVAGKKKQRVGLGSVYKNAKQTLSLATDSAVAATGRARKTSQKARKARTDFKRKK